MSTPFDAAIAAIAQARYHNHRLEAHSDIVSDGIVTDLKAACDAFRADVDCGAVRIWKNVGSPGDRERRVDLFVGEPDVHGKPDMNTVRIAIENKSVITAHRNRTNRFDDLKKVVSAVQGARPQALVIADSPDRPRGPSSEYSGSGTQVLSGPRGRVRRDGETQVVVR